MTNIEILSQFTTLVMELQEEYLKKPQDFKKQERLQAEYSALKAEILRRMERI